MSASRAVLNLPYNRVVADVIGCLEPIRGASTMTLPEKQVVS